MGDPSLRGGQEGLYGSALQDNKGKKYRSYSRDIKISVLQMLQED